MKSQVKRATACSLIGMLVVIGCGGKPQDASATTQGRDTAADSTKPVAQAPPAAAQGSATIRGTVKFSGSAPAQERVKMDADPQCQLQHAEPVQKQDVVVNPNGTLRNVFVYVKEGLEGRTFPVPTQAAMLDQHGCLYAPRVLGLQVNQPLQIVNSDATLHNVNCKSSNSKPFNIAQPVKGMKSTKTFTAPEIMVKCACNVHPWMAMYIGVVAHPYFGVSDEHGSFTLAGLPAGRYTLEAWHEKYGANTQTVSISDGESKDVSFEFAAP